MNLSDAYFEKLRQIMEEIRDDRAPLNRAVDLVTDTLSRGGMFYIFGTGHSHMLGLELFYRAGGLVKMCPILDEGLMLHTSAACSSRYERLPGYAEIVLSRYDLNAGDTMVICSNSGINAVPVETAMWCKDAGVSTIALTNVRQSAASKSRHASGKRLYELCDVVLDNKGDIGDACLCIPGSEKKFAPTSSICGMLILHMLVAGTVEKLADGGKIPDVYQSNNMPGGDDVNGTYIKAYRKTIRHL